MGRFRVDQTRVPSWHRAARIFLAEFAWPRDRPAIDQGMSQVAVEIKIRRDDRIGLFQRSAFLWRTDGQKDAPVRPRPWRRSGKDIQGFRHGKPGR